MTEGLRRMLTLKQIDLFCNSTKSDLRGFLLYSSTSPLSLLSRWQTFSQRLARGERSGAPGLNRDSQAAFDLHSVDTRGTDLLSPHSTFSTVSHCTSRSTVMPYQGSPLTVGTGTVHSAVEGLKNHRHCAALGPQCERCRESAKVSSNSEYFSCRLYGCGGEWFSMLHWIDTCSRHSTRALHKL